MENFIPKIKEEIIMAKLKRVLAGALSLCMVGSMLTACGSSSSSDDAASSSKKADSSKADS